MKESCHVNKYLRQWPSFWSYFTYCICSISRMNERKKVKFSYICKCVYRKRKLISCLSFDKSCFKTSAASLIVYPISSGTKYRLGSFLLLQWIHFLHNPLIGALNVWGARLVRISFNINISLEWCQVLVYSHKGCVSILLHANHVISLFVLFS